MNRSSLAILWLIPVNFSLFVAPGKVAANDLDLSADTPDVIVSTSAESRRSIRLPSLEYTFSVSAVCRSGLSPAVFSLSIADTRMTMTASEIPANPRFIVAIKVPEKQMAPVTATQFCIPERENADDAVSKLLVPAFLSAQASLLCADDTTSEMTYASMPLNVTISCEKTAPD